MSRVTVLRDVEITWLFCYWYIVQTIYRYIILTSHNTRNPFVPTALSNRQSIRRLIRRVKYLIPQELVFARTTKGG